MSIPNTSNTDPLYVERQPDWNQTPELTATHSTGIIVARSGMEQRIRGRATPIYRLSYAERGLSRSTAMARMARAAAEVAAPCIVPFWTEQALATAPLTLHSLTIDVFPRAEWFVVGQTVYVYSDDLGGQFRIISSVVDRLISFETIGSPNAYAAGARVIPCRTCRRVMGDDRFTRQTERDHVETFVYETID